MARRRDGSMRRCAIIGAGMAGLTAADALRRHGISVTIFEKSRNHGGRIATRHTLAGAFNHGAPRIETRSAEFAAFLRSIGANELPDGTFCGVPEMRAIFDPLMRDVRVRWRITIDRIELHRGGWYLKSQGGAQHGPFDAVLVTAPAPQSARIINGADHELSDRLSAIRMESVWTGMIVFDRTIALPESVAGGECLARDADAQGRASGWVVHMGRDWTDTHLENDAAFTAVLLLEEIQATLGERLPPTRFLTAHRWRFARARSPMGAPSVGCDEKRIWAGGDWALGTCAEDAWMSGRDLAQQVIESMVSA